MADPVTYTDEEGNEIEVMPPEEIEALKTKAQKTEELEAAIAEKEAEIAKLRSKDNNFTKFREKTEEEKAKIMEKATEKEKMVLEELNELRKERDSEKKTRFEAAKTTILESLAGSDEDLKKQIEVRAKEWGEAKTPEELEKRYTDAYVLVTARKPGVSPLNAWMPGTTTYQAQPKPKAYVETDDGKAMYARMFPNSPIVKQEKK